MFLAMPIFLVTKLTFNTNDFDVFLRNGKFALFYTKKYFKIIFKK